ncbi:hypothetical protein NX059_012205 [Plenodomus lindquistii]|nr:hypothetical protein NX059_012205 [Plenodomus lindquistii]
MERYVELFVVDALQKGGKNDGKLGFEKAFAKKCRALTPLTTSEEIVSKKRQVALLCARMRNPQRNVQIEEFNNLASPFKILVSVAEKRTRRTSYSPAFRLLLGLSVSTPQPATRAKGACEISVENHQMSTLAKPVEADRNLAHPSQERRWR